MTPGTVYIADRDERGRWRILREEPGGRSDICGAIDEAVAREECRILNAMHRAAK